VHNIFRNLHLSAGFFLVLFLIQSNSCLAMDPKFELDLNTLGKKQIQPEGIAPPSLKAADPPRRTNNTGRKKSVKSKGRSGKKTSIHSSTLRYPRTVHQKQRTNAAAVANAVSQPDVYHSLRIISRDIRQEDEIARVRDVWYKLVNGGGIEKDSLQVSGNNFALSLDPARYPAFPASDGGKIIIDAKRSLPHFVKAIIQGKDPKIRIVETSPDNRKRFYASLLAAASFYSVEENFSVNYGSDPELTVTADFKIEKNTESLQLNDVTLLNIDEKRMGLPLPLIDFLAKDGFQVVDLYPVYVEPERVKNNNLYSIRSPNQLAIVDSLLRILPVRHESDRNIPIDYGSASGVNLSIRAERYMERDGKGIVVSFNDADPVNYTLLKLLETKGYKVVMINPEDGFRQITEKILSKVKFPANYGMHSLVRQQDAPFNVHMSGFVIPGAEGAGSTTLLTDVEVNPLIRVLADAAGYRFTEN
jgi:hypothetical protein